jgi:hypothetical protein
MQSAPTIPTMTELGYPMNIRSWWAALVPSGTPKPVIDQLNAWFSQVVESPETKTFLHGIASDPWVSKPDEGQAYFLQQIKDWGYVSPISSRRLGAVPSNASPANWCHPGSSPGQVFAGAAASARGGGSRSTARR